MNRYVDKETMRGIIREQEKSHGIRGLAWIEMAMDKQEDADVQEVRHGKWEKCKEYCCEYRCSVCEYELCRTTNYCPNCGAKMDGERGIDTNKG